MKTNKREMPVTKFTCLFFFFTVISVSTLWAQRNESEGEAWGILGVGLTSVRTGGDFDGIRYFTGGGSTERVPLLESATGLKVLAGFQFRYYSVELSYSRSEHDGRRLSQDGFSPDISMRSLLDSYDLDFKFFILPRLKIRPLVALGVGAKVFTVKDGSFACTERRGIYCYQGSSEDAKFDGLHLRYGGGFEVRLTEIIRINALALYSYGGYASVRGVEDGDLTPHIDDARITFSTELKILFDAR